VVAPRRPYRPLPLDDSNSAQLWPGRPGVPNLLNFIFLHIHILLPSFPPLVLLIVHDDAVLISKVGHLLLQKLD